MGCAARAALGANGNGCAVDRPQIGMQFSAPFCVANESRAQLADGWQQSGEREARGTCGSGGARNAAFVRADSPASDTLQPRMLSRDGIQPRVLSRDPSTATAAVTESPQTCVLPDEQPANLT